MSEPARGSRRITIALVALIVAGAGGILAYRAFRPDSPSIRSASRDHVFPAIWPESTWEQLDASQAAADQGRDAWRLRAEDTAVRFATEVLGWEASRLDAEITLTDEVTGVVTVGIANPDICCAEHGLILGVRQLGGPGAGGVWSVQTALGGFLEVETPEEGWDLPAGEPLPLRGYVTLAPPPHGDGPEGAVPLPFDPGLYVTPDRLQGEVYILPGDGEPLDPTNALAREEVSFFEDSSSFEARLEALPRDSDDSVILVVRAFDDTSRTIGLAALRIGIAKILEVAVYFGSGVAPGEPVPVTRWVPRTGNRLAAAIEELTKGPTPEEHAEGLTSPFSAATLGLVSTTGLPYEGTLDVELDERLKELIPRSERQAFEAQLNATIFQFPWLDRIQYFVDGGCPPPGFPIEGCATVARPLAAGSELPPAVAETRDAIFEAASHGDYEALGALADSEGFRYSTSGSGDPIEYWKQQAIDAIDILPVLQHTLSAEPRVGADGTYIWPSVHGKTLQEWTDEESEWLDGLDSVEDDASIWYDDASAFVGYRVGIAPDGTWVFFVEGPAS